MQTKATRKAATVIIPHDEDLQYLPRPELAPVDNGVSDTALSKLFAGLQLHEVHCQCSKDLSAILWMDTKYRGRGSLLKVGSINQHSLRFTARCYHSICIHKEDETVEETSHV